MKRTLTTLALLGFLSLTATGCSSGDSTDPLSFGAISSNLTPELRSTTERRIDRRANNAYTNNLDARMFHDDWSRAWYTDHPSRLSPLPIRYTSGKPR